MKYCNKIYDRFGPLAVIDLHFRCIFSESAWHFFSLFLIEWISKIGKTSICYRCFNLIVAQCPIMVAHVQNIDHYYNGH